jgi:hypothetical protein
MDQDEHFRRNAVEAEQFAARSKSATARRRWLRIARGWLGLTNKQLSKPDQPNSRLEARLGTEGRNERTGNS